MDIEHAMDAFDAMTSTERKMVGALQEKLLTEDESGGADGMWFIRAVELVKTN